jgi:hypothetical protein
MKTLVTAGGRSIRREATMRDLMSELGMDVTIPMGSLVKSDQTITVVIEETHMLLSTRFPDMDPIDMDYLLSHGNRSAFIPSGLPEKRKKTRKQNNSKKVKRK